MTNSPPRLHVFRHNDPDETEGRRLYRVRAEGEARRVLARARHSVSYRALTA